MQASRIGRNSVVPLNYSVMVVLLMEMRAFHPFQRLHLAYACWDLNVHSSIIVQKDVCVCVCVGTLISKVLSLEPFRRCPMVEHTHPIAKLLATTKAGKHINIH